MDDERGEGNYPSFSTPSPSHTRGRKETPGCFDTITLPIRAQRTIGDKMGIHMYPLHLASIFSFFDLYQKTTYKKNSFKVLHFIINILYLLTHDD